MLVTRMYKAVKEDKNQQKRKQKRCKAIKFTTLTALGIGTTIGAAMIYKKSKSKQCEVYDDYMYNLENYDNEVKETSELEEKINEFNSNRLSYENEEHPSNEEIQKVMNKIDTVDNDLDKH
ncbi:hypothetical protein [Paraclostridium tenue]|uniref:YtxH domain-containing protein n=1 Tax=Paraclostridium tenue TaxID=1737 RepID=A0ABN1M377_9FIRM